MPARRIDPSRILTATERSARRWQRLQTIRQAAEAVAAAHKSGGDTRKALAALEVALRGPAPDTNKAKMAELMWRPEGASGAEIEAVTGYKLGYHAYARDLARVHGCRYRTEGRGKDARYYLFPLETGR
jgi:hypothetical protein